MPSDNDHLESGGRLLLCEPASLSLFERARAFFASPESFRQKNPNMDIVPFYGLSYMRSTCVLQSANMVESSPLQLDGKFCFHLIFSTWWFVFH